MADDKLKQAAERGFLGFGALYDSAVNKAKENLAQGLNEFGIADQTPPLPKEAVENPNSAFEQQKAKNQAGEAFRQRQQKGSYKGY